MPRDDAYAIVQRHALAALDGGPPFERALAQDDRVRAVLAAGELERCFDPASQLRSVDALFARAEAPA